MFLTSIKIFSLQQNALTRRVQVFTSGKKISCNISFVLLSIVFLQFFYSPLLAQSKVFQIKADSVRIFSNCDTAEFILENRTRDITNAVLTNKGRGVTEFKKVLYKINDTLYTIGGDTINTITFGVNLYNANGALRGNRVVDGNSQSLQFRNNESSLIANIKRPVILSRTGLDSVLADNITTIATSPFSGLAVRGTGCDVTMNLISDSVGSCNEGQQIDFTTVKPRKDSWLSAVAAKNPDIDKYLLGRIQLLTDNRYADYAKMGFSIKTDTVFYKDGAYSLYIPGTRGGYTPYPLLALKPAFKDNDLGLHVKMPYAQVNGGLFVGYGRDWYFNSKNANDIISGVDDVPGYTNPFFETRFSVYADSLPLKIYKLPNLRANSFLTYSPTKTAEGNNVAFEYKDSVYEEMRNYVSMKGFTTPSDISLKENITATTFDVHRLLDMPVKDFNYRKDMAKTKYTGLIAQELKKNLPELVQGIEGNYSIDYVKMVPYLLKIVQEQQKQIDMLAKRVETVLAQSTNK